MNKQDLRNYAELSALLERRRLNLKLEPYRNAADDAGDLRAIASKLHRWSERQCNEDLTCPNCRGEGQFGPDDERCKQCAGRGNTLGRREARAEERAREIASAYRMRAYFQGDPRGCPLYLIPEENVPTDGETLGTYCGAFDGPATTRAEMLEVLQARWIASNYSGRGVAVCH